jgi:hypothetical protein
MTLTVEMVHMSGGTMRWRKPSLVCPPTPAHAPFPALLPSADLYYLRSLPALS